MAWWNPVDWAKSALGDTVGIASNIKNFVVGHVRDAVNAVARDLSDLFSWGINAVADVRDLAQSAWNLAFQFGLWLGDEAMNIWRSVQGLVHQAINDSIAFAERVGGDIEHLASRLIKAAIDDLGDIVDHAWADVVDLWHTAEHYADNVWAVGFRDVIKPLADEVTDGLAAVHHYADQVWAIGFRDVIEPLSDVAQTAAHDAGVALDFALHEGADAVHLVERAAGWLEFLALHTISDIEAIPSEVEQLLSLDWVEGFVRDELPAIASQGKAFAEAHFR